MGVTNTCPKGCMAYEGEYEANKNGYQFCPHCRTELVDKNTLIMCKHCETIVKDGEPSQCEHTLSVYMKY